MNTKEAMTQTEVNAEVLRIVRANDYLTTNKVWKLMKEYLPDVPLEMLYEAINFLYDKVR